MPRASVKSIFVGVIAGAFAALGAVPQDSSVPVVGWFSASSALAYDCSNWVGTNGSPWAFTGLQPAGHSDFGAVQAQISINQPVYVCPGSVNAYSVMLGGPSKSVSGCSTGDKWAFIQDGWLIDGSYSIYHYWESSPYLSCDPGAIIWGTAKNGTSHTYMVQQACTHQGNAGYFYMDGVQMATEGLDWCQGSWLQVVAETQAIANRVGGENIGPMYYCELGLNSVCTPGTGISAGCSNLHGCASPSNPYGCYSQTSSNSFKTWDSRSTPC